MPNQEKFVVSGRVTHSRMAGPIREAEVFLVRIEKRGARPSEAVEIAATRTDFNGRFRFERELEPGEYKVRCVAFGKSVDSHQFEALGEAPREAELDLDLGVTISTHVSGEGGRLVPVGRGTVGKHLTLRVEMVEEPGHIGSVRWSQPRGAAISILGPTEAEFITSQSGVSRVEATIIDRHPQKNGGFAEALMAIDVGISEPEVQMIGGHVGVTLHRTASDPTLDQALWVAIRNRTHAISFPRYREFMNRVLRWEEGDRLPEVIERRMRDLGANLHGVGAYQILKLATEVFLLLETGVRIEPRHQGDRFPLDPLEERSRLGETVSPEQMQIRLREYLGGPAQLPYISRVVDAAFPEYERVYAHQDRVLTGGINQPCLIELIWSYWHEEGMLMQTMNAIAQRFQNVRTGSDRNPLANVEIDPLRPLNNLLWGYVQDEVHRLSVRRRAYEYMHQYGLMLYGKATSGLQPADKRSRFLTSLHNLFYKAHVFFKEDFQTTVIADGFPLLNALQEVHMVLAEGAHNQFGDLGWTARVEMLLTEYMLARPEIREFLQSRVMVPYKEAWMPQVDAMKTLQGWSDVSIAHFRDLGVYGEQLLLSIRYGDWIHVNNEDSAKNWARYWRPEIQGYMHAYRAATGVDLATAEADTTLPGVHLQRRMPTQQPRVRPGM